MKKIVFIFTCLIVLSAVFVYTWIFSYASFHKGDYKKGVLAVNTNKTVYSTGEQVKIYLSTLDSKGQTICNSDLELDVVSPSGQKTTLSTKNRTIKYSPSCGENNVTSDPDYLAFYFPEKNGTYRIVFKNLGTKLQTSTRFSVTKNTSISLERFASIRINPFASSRYSVHLIVRSREAFTGEVIEKIPSTFKVVWQGQSKVRTEGNFTYITWKVNMKKNQEQKISYDYEPPKISPEFYELGPVKITGNHTYDEFAAWQIASDPSNNCYAQATGNWNTSATWTGCGSTTPQPGDFVYIPSPYTVTVDTDTNINRITVQSGGALQADNNSRTITLVPSSSTNAAFAITSGGSWTPGNSTVNFDANITCLLTNGNLTFYNLKVDPNFSSTITFTFGSGTLTVNNNFEVMPIRPSGPSRTLTVKMGGAINVTGSTTLSASGASAALIFDSVAGSDFPLTSGTLEIQTNATYTPQNSSITLNGSSGPLFKMSGGVFTAGFSGVNFTSSSDVILNSGQITFAIMTVNMPGHTITLGDPITIGASGGIEVVAGTLDDGGNQITGNAVGTLTIDAGATLSLGSGATATQFPTAFISTSINLSNTSTITYKAGVGQTVSATPASYGNLSLLPTITGNVTHSIGNTVTVNGDLTINPTSSGSNTLTVQMGGAITMGSSSTLSITATTSALSNLDTTASNYAITTGLLNIGSGGQLTANGSVITLTGTGTPLTVNGTYTYNTSTISYTGNGAVVTALSGSSGTNGYYNLKTVPTGSSAQTLGTASAQSLVINNLWTIGNGTNAGVSGSLNNPSITTSGITIAASATFVAPGTGGGLTVAGNWVNSGTFTHNSGLVTFGTTGGQTITGSTTFFGLSVAASSSRTVVFNAGNTFSVASNGSLTLIGSATATLTLQSSSGSDWNLQVSTTGTSVKVSYVSVSNSNAAGYKLISATDGTNTNGGSNTNWLFIAVLDHYLVSISTPQSVNTCFTGTNVVTAVDAGDGTITSDTSTVNITSTGNGVTFYTASNCLTPTTSYTLAGGTAPIYMKAVVGQPTFYVRVVKSGSTENGISNGIDIPFVGQNLRTIQGPVQIQGNVQF